MKTPHTAIEQIDRYLSRMLEIGASDLHISSECFPLARLHGRLVQIDEAFLRAPDVDRLVERLLEPGEWQALPERKNIDFAYETTCGGRRRRFRCNVYTHALGLSAVLRAIPYQIPTVDECGLPEQAKALTRHHQGLVMVTGPAGCGKTTTLAALIGYINDRKRVHVISVEDPIEFVHESRMALIHQRQLGVDVDTYQNALRGALREDPDVILIGELRDLETTQLAITAAETGHLVLSTMHTTNAAKTVERLIDQFPVDQQPQIRLMLSESLKGIISQQLVPRLDGNGRALAAEVLLVNPAVAHLIREGRGYQIPSVMQTQRGAGMIRMDDSLAALFREGLISEQDARLRMTDQTPLDY